MKITLSASSGFSLVELIVAIAIFMIFAGGMITAAVGGHLNNLENIKLTEANIVSIETWEAIKSIRDDDWSKITNGTYGLSSSGNFWHFSGSSDVQNGFTRTIGIYDVLRSDQGKIVTANGDIDPDTKLISIQLDWTPIEGRQKSFYNESYITNYEDAVTWPPE